MPDIHLSDDVFQRLQRHARPLIDTPDAVVGRALDALEESVAASADSMPDPFRFTDRNIPDLRHAKLLKASLDGRPVNDATWNAVLDRLIEIGVEYGMSADDFREIQGLNIVPGSKTIEGYRYLRKARMSVQGQDANRAARAALSIAKKVGAILEIEFVWRDKPGAAHPGRKAMVGSSRSPSLDKNA